MKTTFLPLVVLGVLLLAAGCGDNTSNESSGTHIDGKPVVYTTNYPLFYFAQRIAGSVAAVQFPEIDGDPAFWQPEDEQVTSMQAASLILINGATYEKWATTVSLPSAKTIDTSAGFTDRFIAIADAATHSHGKDGEHSHTGTAFTTWMDFDQARQQALAVRDALIVLLPDQADTLSANADTLLADLAKLDTDIQSIATAIGNRPLVASHPVYHYFARRYALNIKPVLWEPETVPSAEEVNVLQAILAEHPAQWMIWEGEPAAESVALLKTIGVGSVVVDPAGNRPDAGDWLTVMQQNVANLKKLAPGSAD